ncbi:glycosyltransferase, partial [Methylobacterium soli]
QLIGPFQKASGLGQAARLSAQMIELSGFKAHAVDFGIDNPAPEGFSTAFEHGCLKRAKVNLLHLNAESIPLAFAYMPDIFTGSYNIGYFYWELDSPANCHYLALDLLDEIWVSSEYCKDIYAQFTSKPVINVGMCAETLKDVSRAESKSFVREKFGFTDEVFIFLAAFDSFSFVQRKNPVSVVRAFRAAFPNEKNVRLVLKTHNRQFVSDPQQDRIWKAVEEEVEEDDRIFFLNETLQYSDLRKLKAGVDCYISLHRSEGWGFGMIESMASGIPVVATAYSGNMDFCNGDNCFLVEYDEAFVRSSDYIFVVAGQKWAEPQIGSAVEQMRRVYWDEAERNKRVQAASHFVDRYFGPRAISSRYGDRIRNVMSFRGAGIE